MPRRPFLKKCLLGLAWMGFLVWCGPPSMSGRRGTTAEPLRSGNGASATTYFVRPDGSDSVCNGTVDAPARSAPNCAYRTPQQAWDVGVLSTCAGSSCAGGVDVLIHAGTYSAPGSRLCPQSASQPLSVILCMDDHSSSPYGGSTFAAPVSVQAAPREVVTFDGGGTINNGAYIWRVSNVLLKGIRFRNFVGDRGSGPARTGASVVVGSSNRSMVTDNVTIDGVDVRDNFNCTDSETGDVALGTSAGSHNLVLQNSYIESRCIYGLVVNSNSSGGVDSHDLIQNNEINNVTTRSPYRAMQSHFVRFVTLDGNYIHGTCGSDCEGIQPRDTTNWVITNNVFENMSRCLHAFDEGADGDQRESHIIVNNSFIGCSRESIDLENTDDTTVRNNLFFGGGTGVHYRDSGDATSGGPVPATTIAFSLFYNTPNPYTQGSGGHAPTGYIVDASHDQVGDPNFLDGHSMRPAPYYVPQAPSPALNNGENVTCARTPEDGQCDIGAFENGGGTSRASPVLHLIPGAVASSAWAPSR